VLRATRLVLGVLLARHGRRELRGNTEVVHLMRSPCIFLEGEVLCGGEVGERRVIMQRRAGTGQVWHTEQVWLDSTGQSCSRSDVCGREARTNPNPNPNPNPITLILTLTLTLTLTLCNPNPSPKPITPTLSLFNPIPGYRIQGFAIHRDFGRYIHRRNNGIRVYWGRISLVRGAILREQSGPKVENERRGCSGHRAPACPAAGWSS